jgi:hypothetical protein
MGKGRPPAKPREQPPRIIAMDFAALNWFSLTGIGVALLLLAIAYAKLRNRSSRQVIEKSEIATHDLYDEEDRAHRNDGNGRV